MVILISNMSNLGNFKCLKMQFTFSDSSFGFFISLLCAEATKKETATGTFTATTAQLLDLREDNHRDDHQTAGPLVLELKPRE